MKNLRSMAVLRRAGAEGQGLWKAYAMKGAYPRKALAGQPRECAGMCNKQIAGGSRTLDPNSSSVKW